MYINGKIAASEIPNLDNKIAVTVTNDDLTKYDSLVSYYYIQMYKKNQLGIKKQKVNATPFLKAYIERKEIRCLAKYKGLSS